MTIDQLTALITAVAADELPIWDADEAKAKKITVQDFINSVVTIANLLKQTDVVNSLTSTSTTAPLSAAQGKALNDKIIITGETDRIKIDLVGASWTTSGAWKYTSKTLQDVFGRTDIKIMQQLGWSIAFCIVTFNAAGTGVLIHALTDDVVTYASVYVKGYY